MESTKPMTKINVYEQVTNTIIKELEAGRVPWVQPWQSKGMNAALPENVISKKSYSGINILLLWGAVIEAGYSSQQWLTYKQAKGLGGCVKAGEKGTGIVYASSFVPKDERKAAASDGRDEKTVMFLKKYCVFNVDQCEGLPSALYSAPVLLPECEQIPIAETLIQATGATFRIGGDRAYYDFKNDFVQVPPQPSFRDQINYYRTCFHELGHWTGHPSRLHRDFTGKFATTAYAREELVAELASAFVCATLGIQPTVRHADYIGAWLEVLRNDSRAIFQAASKATKAADYLLAYQQVEQLAA